MVVDVGVCWICFRKLNVVGVVCIVFGSLILGVNFKWMCLGKWLWLDKGVDGCCWWNFVELVSWLDGNWVVSEDNGE